MGIPKAVQAQALWAERLINFEKAILERVTRAVASKLDEILMDIQPILNDIQVSKQGENLSFGTALACLKDEYAMTNDRLEESDTPAAYIILDDDNRFWIKENGKGMPWLPERKDLTTDDWAFYCGNHDGQEED